MGEAPRSEGRAAEGVVRIHTASAGGSSRGVGHLPPVVPEGEELSASGLALMVQGEY